MTPKIKLDAVLEPSSDLKNVGHIAKSAESLGFDGLWSTETRHDPFLQLALAAEPTHMIEFGTGIALSFTRSPMAVAYTAWDLAALSSGRFILGLGTQVKAHNERRFGIPWGAPIPRMREVIEGLRAIWHSWRTGERLNYRGEHYKFTLMTPFFTPAPHEYDIPIYLAGVNTGLCRLAGESCDGFHIHPLNSATYIAQVVRPAISEGAQKFKRTIEHVTLAASVFIVTGEDQTQTDQMLEDVRRQISFYASTPSYRIILEAHGWGEVGEKLGTLAARKEWEHMPQLITDEMVDTFAIVAPPDRLGAALLARYGNLVNRVAPYLPYHPGESDSIWRLLIRDFGEMVN